VVVTYLIHDFTARRYASAGYACGGLVSTRMFACPSICRAQV